MQQIKRLNSKTSVQIVLLNLALNCLCFTKTYIWYNRMLTYAIYNNWIGNFFSRFSFLTNYSSTFNWKTLFRKRNKKLIKRRRCEGELQLHESQSSVRAVRRTKMT